MLFFFLATATEALFLFLLIFLTVLISLRIFSWSCILIICFIAWGDTTFISFRTASCSILIICIITT